METKAYDVELTFSEPLLASSPADEKVYKRFIESKKREEAEERGDEVETQGKAMRSTVRARFGAAKHRPGRAVHGQRVVQQCGAWAVCCAAWHSTGSVLPRAAEVMQRKAPFTGVDA